VEGGPWKYIDTPHTTSNMSPQARTQGYKDVTLRHVAGLRISTSRGEFLRLPTAKSQDTTLHGHVSEKDIPRKVSLCGGCQWLR
jgi:hypothetical protein